MVDKSSEAPAASPKKTEVPVLKVCNCPLLFMVSFSVPATSKRIISSSAPSSTCIKVSSSLSAIVLSSTVPPSTKDKSAVVLSIERSCVSAPEPLAVSQVTLPAPSVVNTCPVVPSVVGKA